MTPEGSETEANAGGVRPLLFKVWAEGIGALGKEKGGLAFWVSFGVCYI